MKYVYSSCLSENQRVLLFVSFQMFNQHVADGLFIIDLIFFRAITCIEGVKYDVLFYFSFGRYCFVNLMTFDVFLRKIFRLCPVFERSQISTFLCLYHFLKHIIYGGGSIKTDTYQSFLTK